MTTSKPLQTSTDSIPDNSVTRNKLGSGSIVANNLFTSFSIANNATAAYFDLLTNTQDPTESNEQTKMLLGGTIKTLSGIIQSNALPNDVTVTLRKNGEDAISFIAKPTDVGQLQYDLNVDFLAGDLLCWKVVGQGINNEGWVIICTQLLIEYNG